MADQKISQLTSASSAIGNELVPIVQSGVTKKATLDQISMLPSVYDPTTVGAPMAFRGETLTIDQLQTMLIIPFPTYGLDLYPDGTPIKIIKGVTDFTNYESANVDYLLTHVVSNGAHKSISPYVLVKMKDTFTGASKKFLKGTYDLNLNTLYAYYNVEMLATQNGIPNTPPTFTLINDEMDNSIITQCNNVGDYIFDFGYNFIIGTAIIQNNIDMQTIISINYAGIGQFQINTGSAFGLQNGLLSNTYIKFMLFI